MTKKRDAEATREKITIAAQQVFSHKGYDAAGTREIAALAGVDVALLGRYFGSKRKLFHAAVLSKFELGWLADVEAGDIAAYTATYFSTKSLDKHWDPMLAVLRSAASSEVADDIRAALSAQMIAPLAARLKGRHRSQRAAMMLIQVAGFDLFRRVVGLEELSAKHLPEIKSLLKIALEQIADRLD